ncbi:MAG: cytochrome c-type biogenesis protein CcmH [Actinomycetota bacterium]|nr:cytochrome c-type biogenesis protein CcmH [Actinomycetota bacterium]MDA3019593.1 cytochrome c-type biogenesis protein CcmH [Actinomycetota bacterium]
MKLKHWSSWLVMLFCVVTLMIVGTQRDSGPTSPQQRIESISKRLACPTCDGESVYESRGAGSQAIRQEIVREVTAGQLSDSQIVKTIDDSYTAELKLVPGGTGFEALIWALPIAVLVVSVAGLVVAFRRWKVQGSVSATDADRELVEIAMQEMGDKRDS